VLYISIVKPTRFTIFWVYWISLYMFQTVFPSVIRSPKLYIQRNVYVIQLRWLFASVPASKQSTNLYDIYMTLYAHFWTHDNRQKDRLKHVEWYSINSKNCASGWFYYRKLISCTETKQFLQIDILIKFCFFPHFTIESNNYQRNYLSIPQIRIFM
jgi:hypothetical protein